MARAVYDASAERYVEFVGTAISDRTEAAVDRAMLGAFVELVRATGGGQVADVGCGPGRVAAYLREHGLDAIGVDPSGAMLAEARRAHAGIEFVEGSLDALPVPAGSLAGAVCWYSIIYTRPDRLGTGFAELRRVLVPGGHLLLAFQAGDGTGVHLADAHGTGLPLTSYRHACADVVERLGLAGFVVHGTAERTEQLSHESTPQAFVIARSS